MRTARQKRRCGKPLAVKEKAEIKALSEMGMSSYKIEKRTGISHNTVDKYLADQAAYNDPKMQEKIARFKEKEILDLSILNMKAKGRLHDLAPRANMIESIALMDRTFQQLRLLEGKSTQNINTLTRIIEEANVEASLPKAAPHVVDIEQEAVSGH